MFFKDFLSYEKTVICHYQGGRVYMLADYSGTLISLVMQNTWTPSTCLFSNFDGNKYDLFKLYKKKYSIFIQISLKAQKIYSQVMEELCSSDRYDWLLAVIMLVHRWNMFVVVLYPFVQALKKKNKLLFYKETFCCTMCMHTTYF